MAELMLVNPRRRKHKRRKMSALQRQYFGKNPSRRRRKRRTRLTINPARRHRVRRLHRNPRRHRVRHLRRNPMRSHGGRFSVRRFMNDALVPAGIGAVGALGVNILLGYVSPSLPVSLQSGIMNTGVKIAGAVAVGMGVGMVAGKRFGEQAMAGAITVTLYDLLKGYVASTMPSLPLSGYHMGWVSPGLQVGPMNEYVGQDRSYTGMGMYVGESEESYYKY